MDGINFSFLTTLDGDPLTEEEMDRYVKDRGEGWFVLDVTGLCTILCPRDARMLTSFALEAKADQHKDNLGLSIPASSAMH